MCNILKVSLKVSAARDFNEVFSLFPLMNCGAKIFNFDVAATK